MPHPEFLYTCIKCSLYTTRNDNRICELCARVPVETEKVKQDINFDRLEQYAYIFKRAISNREPKTAWDVCVSALGHFESVYGQPSQELKDARWVDSFETELPLEELQKKHDALVKEHDVLVLARTILDFIDRTRQNIELDRMPMPRTRETILIDDIETLCKQTMEG